MDFLVFFVGALQLIVFVDAISSWFAGPDSAFRRLTAHITGPLYAPIQKLMPGGGQSGIDFSPMIVILALSLIRELLRGAMV